MNTLIIAHCCQSMAEVAKGPNQHSVLVTAIVCAMFVIIAIIAAITLSQWHKKELELTKWKEDKTDNKTKEERLSKLKADYQSKLLEYIKEKTKDQDTFDDKKDPYLIKIQSFIENTINM